MKVAKVKAELKTIGTVYLNASTMLSLPGTVQYYLSDRLSIYSNRIMRVGAVE